MYALSKCTLDTSVMVLIKPGPARNYKPSEHKGVTWVPWDVLYSGQQDNLLPAMSLLHLILKGLVMSVLWFRPLRIIGFPFGEKTMHWT